MVRLAIDDVTGRCVRRLELGALEPGQHRVAWDGKDDRGRRVPNGVYYCRVDGGGPGAGKSVVVTR
jgi:flagellar basal-body rod modification protein FlgD